ncbi:hypothetical protein ACFFIX_19560 [Metabacillus herbersteinensis]|uniref:Uncharacterized protein n=1 Tax=Metabacillus herbersteinensis TaxID=283816 RepID=A0ABV6GIS7_9BACI
MYLPIIEACMFIFLVLEQYVVERVLEQEIKGRLGYFEMVNKLEVNCISEQEINLSLVPPAVEFENAKANINSHVDSHKPVLTELDRGALDLLSLMQSELGTVKDDETLDEMYQYTDADCPSEQDIENQSDDLISSRGVNKEDCLSINDMNLTDYEEIQPMYTKFSTAKIADGIDGFQQWTVKVIGMEADYILLQMGHALGLELELQKFQD